MFGEKWKRAWLTVRGFQEYFRATYLEQKPELKDVKINLRILNLTKAWVGKESGSSELTWYYVKTRDRATLTLKRKRDGDKAKPTKFLQWNKIT